MSGEILIVDDEVEFTAILAKVLRRRGLAVQLAPSGERAMELLGATRFPVVLLDVKMPGISGLAVLAHIRERHPETSVILMTGHLAAGDEERGAAAGAFAYLLKPYPTERLVALVEEAAAAASRRGEADQVQVDQAHRSESHHG